MSTSRLAVRDSSLSSQIKSLGAGHFTVVVELSQLFIQGWAIGRPHPVKGVVLRAGDGELIARVPVGLDRPDIAEAFAGVEGAPTSGFRARLAASGTGVAKVDVFGVIAGPGEPERLIGSIEVEVASSPGSPASPVTWTVTSVGGESEKVLVGRDGWLFLRGDTNDILGQHTGKVTLTQESRDAWRRTLDSRMAAIERAGAVWEWAIVPDKEALYREQLPEEVVTVDRRPVHDFLDVARGVGAPVRYLLKDLLAMKPSGELYPKIDTHWSHRGAYVGYQAIGRDLRERGVDVELLDEERISWVEERKPGDLGGKCYPEPIVGRATSARIAAQRAALRFDNEVFNHGRVMIFEQPDSTRPSCVVFGESFVNNLLPFLKESFGRLVFVHTSMLVEEILTQERPDVVLTVSIERFLTQVPDDRDALAKLADTARRKGGELPWPPSTSGG